MDTSLSPNPSVPSPDIPITASPSTSEPAIDCESSPTLKQMSALQDKAVAAQMRDSLQCYSLENESALGR